MKNILVLTILLVLGTAAGSYFEPAQAAQAKHDIYYCPMHPNYTSDRPGNCPICGMTLVKKTDAKQEDSSKGIDGYAAVHITGDQQQLMGVRTITARSKTLKKTIHVSGYASPALGAASSVFKQSVYAQVFESDIPLVAVGQKVMVNIPTFDLNVEGTVRLIDLAVDPLTRTVKVRIDLTGVKEKLRTNMLVGVTIPASLANGIIVPRDAVMMTGTRNIVFVKTSTGVFEPREVKVGLEADEAIEIKEGVKEGEELALGANFLIDSESRLQSALAGQGGGQ